MGKLLELLMALDRELPWREFFKEDGVDVFTMFFKLTYYGKDIQYSVCNNETLDKQHEKFELHVIEDNESVGWRLTQMHKMESQINFLINNLLLKMMDAYQDKQMMLICTAELLYSQDNFESTKRIAKIMIIFAQMYTSIDKVEKMKNDHSKFLMGSLFALGGLLKIEAKSYLMTMNEKSVEERQAAQFDLMAPLSNEENPADEHEKRYIRKLNSDDEQFFKRQFCKVVIWFVNNISRGLERQVNIDSFNLLLDLTYESFYDQMTDMEKDEPKKLDLILTSHYVSRFLLDMLQFSFAYFVRAEMVNESVPSERALYDHRAQVDAEKDGADIALTSLTYLIDNFEELLRVLMQSLNAIWTNPFDIVKFWSIKFAEDPEQSRQVAESKDAYDRQDNYDGQGVAIFAYLHMKS